MGKVAGIARYTAVELFRNKVYYVLLLFAVVMCASTLLFGALGGEQRSRMIIDMGLASIELFALAVAVFAAVTLVLEEMESKTLYLVLTRPVARWQFIVGRFVGLMLIITAAFVVMALAHWLVCRLVDVSLSAHYLASLYFSWEKILMISAVAVFFSLFATSTISAVTFTFFFWIMGHLSTEIHFLAQKTSNALLLFLSKLFFYIAPNFTLLNVKDHPAGHLTAVWAWSAGLYALIYAGAAIALAAILFRRKEF